ncbi:MAG TPA: FkbM family methyltransferase [Terracidiphilus sp.]|nr:FkbM family methyltransferase [Terracidiphilus sp.]
MLRKALRDGNPSTLLRRNTSHGLIVAVDPDSIMDSEVVRQGYYEPEILDAILTHLPENEVFWDVGANFGMHAITVQSLRPNARVIAFEPSPVPLSRLTYNVLLNASQVTILPIALGNATGYAQMEIKVSGNTGISSLSPWPGSRYDGHLTARVETGDALISSGLVPRPSVIKIDVEGFEREVLVGLSCLCDSAKNLTLVFESNAEKLGPIMELLEASGFTVSPIFAVGQSSGTNYLARKTQGHRLIMAQLELGGSQLEHGEEV